MEQIGQLIGATIEVNGQTIDLNKQPEFVKYLNELRGVIAQQEKDKLHSKIGQLKEELETLKNVQLKGATNDASFNQETFKKELLEEVKGIVSEMVSPIATQAKAVETQSNETYRNQLLQEHQGKCFPELVVGNSKDDLDKALAASADLYEKYVSKNGKPQTETGQLAGAGNGAEDTTAQVPTPNVQIKVLPNVSSTPPANKEQENIKEMTMDEFAKKREELLKTIKNTF